MQSWMIVSALGVFAAGCLPALPPLFTPLLGALCFYLLARGFAADGAQSCASIAHTVAIFMLGLGYGVWWGSGLLEERLSRVLEARTLSAQIRILEPPQQRRFTGGGQRQRFAADVTLLACPDEIPGCDRRVGKSLLSYYGEHPLRAGQLWNGELKLKRPRGLANPGSFNFESWLASNRFAATGYLREANLVPASGESRAFLQRWRQLLADQLRSAGFDPSVSGVLLALSNGDRGDIDYHRWQQFQRFGLNHLVVISGLHVGLVAGLGFLAGRLAGRRTAHILAALLALLYSALAGFALPTIRALAMLGAVQLAALAGRRIRPLNSLSLALLVISLVDPLSPFGAGFWLSFAAVGLIFLLLAVSPRQSRWHTGIKVQCFLSLATGWLASFWFGGVGWLAAPANLVAVPVLTFWLAPLCLMAALLAPLWPAAAAVGWKLAALPVAGFYQLDAMLVATDWPLWLEFRPPLPALLAGSLGIVLLVLRQTLPLRWLFLPLLLCAFLPGRSGQTATALEFWLLDVGQGLAAVALHRDFVMVYDTGAGDPGGPNMASGVLIPFLEQRGIESIDLLVISHGDRDHAGGVYTLHQRFPVARTWYGEKPLTGLSGQAPCLEDSSYHHGSLGVIVLSGGNLAGSGNNTSCVLRLDFDGFRLLLPGDIEAAVEHRLLREKRPQLPADVMLVPHHGSNSSSSSAFLAAVDPELALVSSGYRNRFGHPHRQVLARYRRFGLAPCDTAGSGAIRLVVENGRLKSLQRWRSQNPRYWLGTASPACAPAYNGALEKSRER